MSKDVRGTAHFTSRAENTDIFDALRVVSQLYPGCLSSRSRSLPSCSLIFLQPARCMPSVLHISHPISGFRKPSLLYMCTSMAGFGVFRNTIHHEQSSSVSTHPEP
jgi:hypothetical protein